MNKTVLKYYTEYHDANGHQHYAVHLYNMVTRFVTSMRDYKFVQQSVY